MTNDVSQRIDEYMAKHGLDPEEERSCGQDKTLTVREILAAAYFTTFKDWLHSEYGPGEKYKGGGAIKLFEKLTGHTRPRNFRHELGLGKTIITPPDEQTDKLTIAFLHENPPMSSDDVDVLGLISGDILKASHYDMARMIIRCRDIEAFCNRLGIAKATLTRYTERRFGMTPRRLRLAAQEHDIYACEDFYTYFMRRAYNKHVTLGTAWGRWKRAQAFLQSVGLDNKKTQATK